MTMNANVTWDLPTTRSNGNPQDPAQLAAVDVSFSADLGATFVPLVSVIASDPQTVLIPDLVDGDYAIRLEVRDLAGLIGLAVDTPFVIDTSVPGTVTNIQITLS